MFSYHIKDIGAVVLKVIFAAGTACEILRSHWLVFTVSASDLPLSHAMRSLPVQIPLPA